jgi:UPF0755 protein
MNRRSRYLLFLGLIMGLGLCAVALIAGYTIYQLPVRVEQTYGPADPSLDFTERMYLSIKLLGYESELTVPQNPFAEAQGFQIDLGESTASMIDRLKSQGLISSRDAFRVYLQYSGLDRTIQAGSYSISPGMNAIQIAHALQDATPTEIVFTILAGWRIEEIADSLPTSGLDITPDAFLEAAASPNSGYSFSEELPVDASLEGFLSPGIYTLPRQATLEDLFATILGNSGASLTPDLREGFEHQGLGLYEAVTLASIVERETVVEEEMPMIASVFLNRLASNIKLETDPTVQYALGYNPQQETWWTNPLTLQDLEIDSPYNTYKYPGLPPGPISNPSLTALRAVAFPALTPYLYFRSACDDSGRHSFSETFEEHVSKACN